MIGMSVFFASASFLALSLSVKLWVSILTVFMSVIFAAVAILDPLAVGFAGQDSVELVTMGILLVVAVALGLPSQFYAEAIDRWTKSRLQALRKGSPWRVAYGAIRYRNPLVIGILFMSFGLAVAVSPGLYLVFATIVVALVAPRWGTVSFPLHRLLVHVHPELRTRLKVVNGVVGLSLAASFFFWPVLAELSFGGSAPEYWQLLVVLLVAAGLMALYGRLYARAASVEQGSGSFALRFQRASDLAVEISWNLALAAIATVTAALASPWFPSLLVGVGLPIAVAAWRWRQREAAASPHAISPGEGSARS